jgi:hypothetical protein
MAQHCLLAYGFGHWLDASVHLAVLPLVAKRLSYRVLQRQQQQQLDFSSSFSFESI